MTGRGTGLWAGLAIVLAVLAAYHNSFAGPFVFDDADSIVHNPTITRLWPPGAVLAPPGAQGQTVGGRPVLNLSLALNYAVGGLGVRGYHAANLLIHLLAALALFGLLRRTLPAGGAAELLAFGTALLWAVHPLQTEAVTYVVQRAESLMGLFYLTTFYAFARYAGTGEGEGGSRGWAALAILACFLGMGTKEVMVSAPVLAVLYDRTCCSGSFRAAWRRHGAVHLALAASWIPLAALVLASHQRGGSTGFGSGVSWGHYVLTQFPAVAHYLRLAVWPRPLIFDYGTRWVGPGGFVLPALLVGGLALASGLAFIQPPDRPRARACGLAGIWFFALLAPTSLIPGNRQTLAEHRMYLPLAPVLAVGLAALGAAGPRRVRRGAGAVAGLLLLAGLAAGLTVRRNRVYRSSLALWSDTVAKLPGNPYAQADLGVALDEAGDEPGAVARYTESLRLDPHPREADKAHDDLGLAWAKQGRMPEAEAEFATALRLNPGFAPAHSNLGNALRREGRRPEAEAELREAIRLQPDYANAWLNLAVLCTDAGRWPEAIAAYRRALALEPDRAEPHFQLANVFAQLGRLSEAIPEYQAALRLEPGHDLARDHLARVLQALGAARP